MCAWYRAVMGVYGGNNYASGRMRDVGELSTKEGI